MCRARSPSFRFSTKIIIVGNLLMKRDSHTKGHPSKSSPPLFDGGGGFFEHTQHRKTKVVLSRDHHHHHDHGPSSRVCAPSKRCSKAHNTFFVRCLGLFFYPIKINLSLFKRNDRNDRTFWDFIRNDRAKTEIPPSPHQPRRRPKGGRKR